MAEQKVTSSKRRKRRLLTPAEKYQVWLEVVSGQGSQREIADKWGVNRSTVTSIVRTAKQGALDRLAAARPGRGGKSAEQVALEDAEAEIVRLRETITAQAVELHLFRGKEPWG
ncbi:MAG: transposase [Acidimicrobiia bacterium]